MLHAAVAAISLLAAGGSHLPAFPREPINANDNRIAAGTLVSRTLHLSIDARWGYWYPDGPDHAGIPMQAFAEAGKPMQIPGPLVRVPAGTDVILQISNSIPDTELRVHGLVDRPADQDRTIDIAYRSHKVVRFRAGAAGTYAYWATTTSAARISSRSGWDSQLSGAIVVDSADESKDVRHDRVFVIGTWLNVYGPGNIRVERYALETFNGRAWPYTERLSYAQGAVVHWRWINAGAVSHPLHLHGFYFTIESRGDGIGEIGYRNAADRDREATELIRPGATFAMTWNADRPGNWLFHCHIPAHTVAHLPFADMLAGKPVMSLDAFLNDYVPHAEMGDMVLGITVHPTASWRAAEQRPSRHLTLFVETAAENASDAPAFRYVLEDGAALLTASGSIGPPLVLTQGVPVAIAVVNHLSEPTSVHWHGMELTDSYYDGASGFSGFKGRIAPMIAPGATFRVQFTPPRAGTFVYHTHLHDLWQFRGGLAGPLIVIPPGSRFDPSTDHVVMLTSTNLVKSVLSGVLINGFGDPPMMVVRAGVLQRFRLINVSATNALDVISLESGAGPVSWKPLAIDGAYLPPSRQLPEPAVQAITIGKTLDFEYTPLSLGDLTFVVRSRAAGPVLGTLSVHVI